MASPAELLANIVNDRENMLNKLRGPQAAMPAPAMQLRIQPPQPQREQNITDPRSLQGMMSRGSNVYDATSLNAHAGGGPQFGRPRLNSNFQEAIARRLGTNAGRP